MHKHVKKKIILQSYLELFMQNLLYRFCLSNVLADKKSVKTTLRGQTVHSVHGKRIPQQANIRFVAESATLLPFFDLLRCFGFYKQMPKTLYRSKLLRK